MCIVEIGEVAFLERGNERKEVKEFKVSQKIASPYSAPNGDTYSGCSGEKDLGIVSFKGLKHFSSFCCS